MNKKKYLNQNEVKRESRRVVKEMLDSERREDHYYDKAFIEMMHSMVSEKIRNRDYIKETRKKD